MTACALWSAITSFSSIYGWKLCSFWLENIAYILFASRYASAFVVMYQWCDVQGWWTLYLFVECNRAAFRGVHSLVFLQTNVYHMRCLYQSILASSCIGRADMVLWENDDTAQYRVELFRIMLSETKSFSFQWKCSQRQYLFRSGLTLSSDNTFAYMSHRSILNSANR